MVLIFYSDIIESKRERKEKEGYRLKAIYFDMDGTIADLYGYQNWESKLRQEDVTPYRECQPLVDMNILNQVLTSLTKFGIIIGTDCIDPCFSVFWRIVFVDSLFFCSLFYFFGSNGFG